MSFTNYTAFVKHIQVIFGIYYHDMFWEDFPIDSSYYYLLAEIFGGENFQGSYMRANSIETGNKHDLSSHVFLGQMND